MHFNIGLGFDQYPRVNLIRIRVSELHLADILVTFSSDSFQSSSPLEQSKLLAAAQISLAFLTSS